MTLQTMAMIAAALLVIYIAAIIIVILKPSRRPDPHDGMARGCLTFVVLGLLIVGGTLAIGYFADVPLLVHLPFYVTVYPTILLIGSVIVNAFRKRK